MNFTHCGIGYYLHRRGLRREQFAKCSPVGRCNYTSLRCPGAVRGPEGELQEPVRQRGQELCRDCSRVHQPGKLICVWMNINGWMNNEHEYRNEYEGKNRYRRDERNLNKRYRMDK